MDMRSAHAHLVARGLNDSHFDTVIEDLAATLKELKVPAALIERVAALAQAQTRQRARPLTRRRGKGCCLRSEGKPVSADDEGYLVDPADWSREVCRGKWRARRGIVLTEAHWVVIEFVRKYFEQRQIIPGRPRPRHQVSGRIEGWRQARGETSYSSSFPTAMSNRPCRIAGMRRPRAWSTG